MCDLFALILFVCLFALIYLDRRRRRDMDERARPRAVQHTSSSKAYDEELLLRFFFMCFDYLCMCLGLYLFSHLFVLFDRCVSLC